jgi:NAD(P)-dependent dehydrogenase (short-subunit alcohol dehydrogenase family)
MKIQHSVALVTGANRGLGRSFAKALLARGAKVYAAARDPRTIDLPGAIPLQLDVTKPDELAAGVRAAGDLTLLVNNAGIALNTQILSPEAPAALHAELETNVFGPLVASQAFAPVLAKNGGGAIINVLSALSWISFPGVATYSASKSAMWSVTNALRNALAAQQTQVVAVHVGFMDTDMAATVTSPKTSPDQVAATALAALEAGEIEVLADEVSKQLKAGLSHGAYLGTPPSARG